MDLLYPCAVENPSEDTDKCFWSSTYFTEGHTGLLREAIGPRVQLLLERGPYQI